MSNFRGREKAENKVPPKLKAVIKRGKEANHEQGVSKEQEEGLAGAKNGPREKGLAKRGRKHTNHNRQHRVIAKM